MKPSWAAFAEFAGADPLPRAAGSVLSARPDLLPREVCDALARLAPGKGEPMSEADVRSLLHEELGRPLVELFDGFDMTPDRVSLVWQEHRATAKDGVPVTVRIRHRGWRLRIAEAFSDERSWLAAVRSLGIERGAASELLKDLREELLRRGEMVSAAESEGGEPLGTPSDSWQEPRLVAELCGRRMVTYEENGGVPLMIGGEVAVETGELILESASLRLLHARCPVQSFDPESLRLIAGKKVAWIDLRPGRGLSRESASRVLDFLLAAAEGEVATLLRRLQEIVGTVDPVRRESLRQDLQQRADLLADTGDPHGRSTLAATLLDCVRIPHRHGAAVPRWFRTTALHLVAVEDHCRRLGSPADLGVICRRHFARLRRSAAVERIDREEMARFLSQVAELVRRSPGHLNALLAELANGRFVLNVYESESPAAARSRNRRAKLITSAVLVLAVATLLARDPTPTVFGLPTEGLLIVLLGLLAVWTAWQWWRLR